MAVLVLIDHEHGRLKQPSRSAVAAAAKLGEVHALVAGEADAGSAAEAAASLPGVTKVLKAEGGSATSEPVSLADAPSLSAGTGSKLAARTVMTFLGSADFTVASALPA